MSINLTVPKETGTQILKPKLTVIGVGGAGGNAVNNMIKANLEGVDFVVANTDAQALSQSGADRRIQLGAHLTQGLGAGSRPDIGRAAAEEAIDEILAELEGAHMAFIAAGMGGGTGTGGAPVIARAAKENGILTVGVVTKPFQFEGTHRMAQAEVGIEELEQYVDTLIVIPNQNLFRIANEKTTFADAFAMADEVLYSGVRGVTDLMVMPGLINLDFADIRSVMSEMGKAMMGTGEAEGERRALDAAEAAIANPLLDDMSMKGAKGVLINITGGMDITLFEVDEAANRIRAEVDEDAYIIVGSAFDKELEGTMRVSVIATGIDASAQQTPMPTMLHLAEQLEQSPGYGRAWETDFDSEPVPEAAMEDGAEAETEAEAEAETEAEAEAEAYTDPENTEPVSGPAETGQPAAAAELPVLSMMESADEQAPEAQAEEAETETPPPAMPSVGAADAFIPPKPAGTDVAENRAEAPDAPDAPEDDPEESGGEPKTADVESEPRSKRISLFERVTGTSRAAFGKKASHPEPESEVTESKELSATEEVEEKAPDEPETKVASPEDAATDEENAPKLGGMDSEDRITASENEEDLLDIPAFLRRQAN